MINIGKALTEGGNMHQRNILLHWTYWSLFQIKQMNTKESFTSNPKIYFLGPLNLTLRSAPVSVPRKCSRPCACWGCWGWQRRPGFLESWFSTIFCLVCCGARTAKSSKQPQTLSFCKSCLLCWCVVTTDLWHKLCTKTLFFHTRIGC